MHRCEKHIRRGTIITAEALTLMTVAFVLKRGDGLKLALATGTLLLVLVPELAERLFRCRINTAVYVLGVAYAIGPMLGQCWKFYYTVPFWDKLLHICGGVMFVILGIYLFERMSRGSGNNLSSAAFALCFSIAISAVWEFVEYGADLFLGMDMQHDTVVPGITSFLLGTETGVTGSIKNISSVFVDSIPLPVNGYIDIGLHDTMLDMLLESLGALITAAILYADKGRHPLIRGR